MYTAKDRDALLAGFSETATASIKANCTEDIEAFMANGDSRRVLEFVDKVLDNALAATPRELAIPKISRYVTTSGPSEGVINVISLKLGNRLSAKKQFKFRHIISAGSAHNMLVDAVLSSYISLISDAVLAANLVKVNEVLQTMTELASLPFSVEIDTPLSNRGRRLSYLSDDSVVFVADEDALLNLDNILILHEPCEDEGCGSITAEVIQEAIQEEANHYVGAQTPEQFVQNLGFAFVRYICGIPKSVLPMTLIKKVCSKNAANLVGSKDSVAYYNDGKVFAIIGREDGELGYILSPFSIETFRRSDEDVLGKLAKAQ